MDGAAFQLDHLPFCLHFGIRMDSTIRFVTPEVEGVKVLLKFSHVVVAATVRKRERKAT
jgi:hypothetical protein